MSKKILILPGDGIGHEIVAEAVKVLEHVNVRHTLNMRLSFDALGGAAYEKYGSPLADETLARAREADAVLLGAVGGPQWDTIDPALRPERGLLKIRAQLGLFANLRPALLYPQLADASTLKPEVVAGLDILIVRELTGGLYFGQPRGSRISKMASVKRLIRCRIARVKSVVFSRLVLKWRVCVVRNSALWTKQMCLLPVSCGAQWREKWLKIIQM